MERVSNTLNKQTVKWPKGLTANKYLNIQSNVDIWGKLAQAAVFILLPVAFPECQPDRPDLLSFRPQVI